MRLCGIFGSLLVAGPAMALQELDAFVAASLQEGLDVREARFRVDEKDANHATERGRLLPSLQLKGAYTRNQFSSQFPFTAPGKPARLLNVQPGNQLDAYATLTLPLINLANFSSLRGANLELRAQEHAAARARLDVVDKVADAYYKLLSAVGKLRATQRALAATEQSLSMTRARLSSGRAQQLEVSRAQSACEQQVQQQAADRLEVLKRSEGLRLVAGIDPDLSVVPALDVDDLSAELPLERYTERLGQHPRLLGAQAAFDGASARARAEKLKWAPALQGSFQERLTNANAFSQGNPAFFAAGVNLTWDADFIKSPTRRAAQARAGAAAVAAEREARTLAQDLAVAWHTVEANVARCHSARAAQASSREAAQNARLRYGSDLATYLELLEAQRDSFEAEATRLQADADLVVARIRLRLLAGMTAYDRSPTEASR